jgi:hypothetical protein
VCSFGRSQPGKADARIQPPPDFQGIGILSPIIEAIPTSRRLKGISCPGRLRKTDRTEGASQILFTYSDEDTEKKPAKESGS